MRFVILRAQLKGDTACDFSFWKLSKTVQQYQIFLEVVSENLVLLNRPVSFKTRRFNNTKLSYRLSLKIWYC